MPDTVTHQGPHPEHGGLETHVGTRDTCSGPDCGPPDPEDDTSPETLSIDLAQMHLRAMASPLPKQPAAMGWQMTAGSLSALASRLLDVVQRTAPGEAARIAEWFSGPFGDGPDLEEHHDWVTDNISGSWDLTEKWIQEARQLAIKAKQATEAQTKEN